jgi:hypothetical protein
MIYYIWVIFLAKYDFSDGWLLVSIIYCKKGASLKNIISVGDMLNHSIFNLSELSSGLNKLLANRFIDRNREGKYSITQKAEDFYNQNKRAGEGCINEMMRMSAILTKMPCEDYEATINIYENEYKHALGLLRRTISKLQI